MRSLSLLRWIAGLLCVCPCLAQLESDLGKPAPRWLREAGMFNGWYFPWNQDHFDRVKGFPLIVTNTHSREVVEQLQGRGVRVAFYSGFYVLQDLAAMKRKQAAGMVVPEELEIYDLYYNSDFYNLMDISRRPEWIWVGEDGYPREELAAYEDKEGASKQVCPNTPGFREAALEATKAMLDLGADGLFLDCVENHRRKRCWGPEFQLHTHVNPELDDNETWVRLQEEIYALVKSYGEDKVLMLNGGGGTSEYLRHADAFMLESFMLTHVSTRRWQTWAQVRKRAQEVEPIIDAGKVPLALSYVGYTSRGMDEDAFYAYACARLFGYSWADWFTLADARSTLLYRLRLGAPKGEMLESNGIFYRLFEDGIAVVNPSFEDRELKAKTGFTFLRELLTNRRYAPHDESRGMTLDTKELQAIIPAESGRVFINGFSR